MSRGARPPPLLGPLQTCDGTSGREELKSVAGAGLVAGAPRGRLSESLAVNEAVA